MTDAEKKAEHVIGLDTARVWATQAQVLPSSDTGHVLIIFREQALVDLAEVGEQVNISKNVSSVVLPREVAQSLGVVLTGLLGTPETEGDQNGQPA